MFEIRNKYAVALSVEEYESLWSKLGSEKPELIEYLRSVDTDDIEDCQCVFSNVATYITGLLESGVLPRTEEIRALQAGEIAGNLIRFGRTVDETIRLGR